MKRLLTVVVLLLCIGASIAGWYWYRSRTVAEPGPYPYARQVPADAAVYIAIPDLPSALDEINRNPRWKNLLPGQKIFSRVEKNRTKLAGPAALFATLQEGKLHWTTLALLKNGETHVEGTPYDGDFNMLQPVEPFLSDDSRPRVLLNLEVLPPVYRELRSDFSRAILDLDFSPDSLKISGRFLYRGGSYREILENRIHAAPVPDPGNAPFSVSGLTNIENLFTLLKLDAPIPEYDRTILGPAWGMQFRNPEDLGFWFYLSEKPITLDGISWKDFQTHVEGSRWSVYTRSPVEPGSPSEAHEIIRLRMPEAAEIFRARYGNKGDPVLRNLERFARLESRLTYGGDYATATITLSLP